MILYKPKIKRWKDKSIYRNKRFFESRRYDLKDLEKLTKFVWFYWFIVFVIKIGSAFPLMFFNPLNMEISSSNRIVLPVSTGHDLLNISNRHLFPIVIHKDGLIIVESGHETDLENLSKLLFSKRIDDPLLTVLFVVDKNCKMAILNKVINICRENNALVVRFVTNDKYKLIL